jgi:hypothetical protein
MVSNSASDRWLTRALLGLSTMGFAILVLAFLIPNLATANGQHAFVGYQKCRTCHKKEAIGNQFGVWLESRHAKAYETLGTEKAKKWGAEAGVDNPQTDDRCIKCHSTAHGVPDERVSKKFDRTAGVQCESCHGAGKDYKKKKIMMDRDKALEKGLIIPTAELCTGCHNDESPAWDEKAYTLADGSTAGFDFEQAVKKIAHPVPEGYDPAATGEAD